MAITRKAGELEQRLASIDPELVAAADEVDLSLLRWSLSLTPLERLRVCTRTADSLERLRRGLAAQ